MAFRHGYIFSTIRVAIMAVMLFFIIYFLAPGAAMRFFGTSIRDSRVAEVTEGAYETIISDDPSISSDRIMEILSDPKVVQFIISSGLSTEEASAEVVAYVQSEAEGAQ